MSGSCDPSLSLLFLIWMRRMRRCFLLLCLYIPFFFLYSRYSRGGERERFDFFFFLLLSSIFLSFFRARFASLYCRNKAWQDSCGWMMYINKAKKYFFFFFKKGAERTKPGAVIVLLWLCQIPSSPLCARGNDTSTSLCCLWRWGTAIVEEKVDIKRRLGAHNRRFDWIRTDFISSTVHVCACPDEVLPCQKLLPCSFRASRQRTRDEER